jgi:hypothetical protein
VVLWTGRSHARGVSCRGLKGAESAIGNQESGIREVRNSRPRECRFPNQEISR